MKPVTAGRVRLDREQHGHGQHADQSGGDVAERELALQRDPHRDQHHRPHDHGAITAAR